VGKPAKNPAKKRQYRKRGLPLDSLINPPATVPRLSRAEKHGSAMSGVLRAWRER